MTEVRVVDPHTPDEIQKFAAAVGITAHQAAWIDHLRKEYICQEHDYIREPRKGCETREAE